jgi:HAD superfamily hydrolase (TIGR01509 family)
MIKTIIFDAEGVVFDSEPVWDRAQVEFLQRRGIVYERGKLKPLLTGRSLVEGVRVMQELYSFPGEPEALAQERLAMVKKLLADGVKFIDGFEDFYRFIEKKHKVCIATSMDRALFQIVENILNLQSLFTRNIFFIDDVHGKGKPQPDIFLYAAKRLQSLVEECVVIEDAPLGIEAAKRAGMKCIALTTTYGRSRLQNADIIVDNFSQLIRGNDLIIDGQI